MITQDSISRVMGKDVYDQSGDKIGSASEVYLDDESGQPEWVTVKTGLFGTKESFVPIRDADLTDDGVRVSVSKAKVKDAPKVDADGHLSLQEEEELYRYYGLGGGMQTGMQTSGMQTETSGMQTDTAGMRGTDSQRQTSGRQTAGMEQSQTTGMAQTTGREAQGAVGHDTSGPTTDSAMTRSEERLDVGTRQEEVGRARMRKYVVTENATETVPVSHEEARVQREPITDANMGDAMDGPAISEEEHEVTLRGERPVVDKEAVPVERVRLDKQTVQDEEQVSADLGKEQIEVDGPDTPRR